VNFFDIKIETDRLLLVPIELSHAEDNFKYLTTEVTKYMGPKPAEDISETIAWIKSARERMEQGGNVQLVILKKDTGEFIGCAGLHDVDGKTPELGVWTKLTSHGNHFGREAITALYNWACENIGFDYVSYPVDKRNIASRKIPESLGGVIAREFKSINQSGFELTEVEYRIYKNK
jgi:RimJ/RimL family protein N-acetyltransferase